MYGKNSNDGVTKIIADKLSHSKVLRGRLLDINSTSIHISIFPFAKRLS